MQRLIDANALLEKLKQNLRNYRDVMNEDGARATLIAVNDVEKAPTIDAEPVVRCDNCKCSIVNGEDCDSVLVNIRRNHITETNEFVHLYLEYCSNGVKTDEEQE